MNFLRKKKILGLFEKEPFLKGAVPKLHPFLKDETSDRTLQKNLRLLAKYGILEITTGKDTWNRDIEEFSLSPSYNENQSIEIPNYKDLCRISSLPNPPTIPSLPSLPTKNVRGSEGSEGSEGVNRVIKSNNSIEKDLEEAFSDG